MDFDGANQLAVLLRAGALPAQLDFLEERTIGPELGQDSIDAGRLSWFFGREVVAATDPFDPESYEAMLRIDLPKARAAFPAVFKG